MKPFRNEEFGLVTKIIAMACSQLDSSLIGHRANCEVCAEKSAEEGYVWANCPIAEKIEELSSRADSLLMNAATSFRKLDADTPAPVMTPPGSTDN